MSERKQITNLTDPRAKTITEEIAACMDWTKPMPASISRGAFVSDAADDSDSASSIVEALEQFSIAQESTFEVRRAQAACEMGIAVAPAAPGRKSLRFQTLVGRTARRRPCQAIQLRPLAPALK